MWLIDKVKGAINKMLGRDIVEQILSVRPVVSTDMVNAINTWSAMYEGRATWLKNPSPGSPERVVSLGLPAMIASEKARMATMELESEITPPMKDVEKKNPNYQPPSVNEATGEVSMGRDSMIITEPEPDGPTERADFLNTSYKKLKKAIRRQLEYGIAKGGLVIKPYVVEYDESTATTEPRSEDSDKDKDRLSAEKPLPKYEIEFDYIQADKFYPFAFDNNGKITEAAFLQYKTDHNKVYTRVEHHKLEGRHVIVSNYAFVSTNHDQSRSYISEANDLGKPCSLSEVPEWASIQERVVIENVDRPLFAYFKMPEANTIDPYSPLGVSGYSRAVSLIKDADEQYSRLLWEYEGGELAIDVDRDALKIQELQDGAHQTELPAKQERLFRKVDLNSEETYNVFAPPLRDQSIVAGLNTILTRIEDVTGLSRGTISADVDVIVKTATELKINKQRSYSANKDIQIALEDALRDTVYAMDALCSLYQITPPGEYEISFEWDNSIIEDASEELEKRLSMLNAGITSKLEIRMWYFGETENQAKAALQKVEDEKKLSMETNIMAQAELGQVGQGNDFSGNNNNPNSNPERNKNNPNGQGNKNAVNNQKNVK